MNEEEPPDLTIRVYQTIICPRHLPKKISRYFVSLKNIPRYFPIVLGNGTIDEGLKKSFSAKVIGTYKIKSKYEDAFYGLCKNLLGEKEIVFRKNVERFLKKGNADMLKL